MNAQTLACVPHSMCSIKWHHRFVHDITCVQGLEKYQKILIGVSVTLILLLALLLLLFLLRLQRHKQCCKSGKWKTVRSCLAEK